MIFNKLNNNIRIRIDNCLNEGKFNSLFVAVSLVFLLLFQCGCSSDTVIPYADEQSDEIIESVKLILKGEIAKIYRCNNIRILFFNRLTDGGDKNE